MFGFYRTYTTPFKQSIPADLQSHFAKASAYKRFRRFFFRYLYKNISLFNSKELACITDKHKSILWMHFSEPYIGDSLMDLSSRVLLKNRNIDLLTEKNISHYMKMTQYLIVFSQTLKNVTLENTT